MTGLDQKADREVEFYLKLAATWAGMGFCFDPQLLKREELQIEADQAARAYTQWLKHNFGMIEGLLTKAVLRVTSEYNGDQVSKLLSELEDIFDLVAFRYMMGGPILSVAITADKLDLGDVRSRMGIFYKVAMDFRAQAGTIGKAWLGGSKMPVMGVSHCIFFDPGCFAKKAMAIIKRGKRSSFWKAVYAVPCVYDVEKSRLLEHSGPPFFFGVTVTKGQLYRDFRRVFASWEDIVLEPGE